MPTRKRPLLRSSELPDRAMRADTPIKLSIDGPTVGENVTFLADRF
jgi:hypothetical protein